MSKEDNVVTFLVALDELYFTHRDGCGQRLRLMYRCDVNVQMIGIEEVKMSIITLHKYDSC